MTISTENAAPRNPANRDTQIPQVQIHMKSKSQFEFVPRDTEKSEFPDLADFEDAAFSVETVIFVCMYVSGL